MEIKPSAVNGQGVFTTRPFSAGDMMIVYEGVKMLKSDFIVQYGSDIRYTYWTNHNFKNTCVYVSKENRNIITFINESATPNVHLKNRKLFATRDLVSGEELFLKYAKAYPRDYELSQQ